MKRLLIPALVLLPLLAAEGQNNFKKVGTAGYVFLEIPVSARTAALGEAASAVFDGAAGVFGNPATIAVERSTQSISISYADWFADTKHEALAYAYDGGTYGVFALHIDRLDYGTMQGTVNPDPTTIGKYLVTDPFTADAYALGATWARNMTDRFSFGGTVKYVQERIADYRSTNVLVDAGIVYNTGFHSLRVAGAMRNFGVDSKYLQGVFRMPTEMRLGVAADVLGSPDEQHCVTVSVDAAHPSDNDERIDTGVEYVFGGEFFARAGYKINYDEESWSLGGGVRWSAFALDAAYSDYGRLGGILRITLGAGL